MIPRSLSASALSVAEGCLARYKATNMDRGADFSNDAALLGTSVHGALEEFVKAYMANGIKGSIQDLHMYFAVSYQETFGTSDTSAPNFAEGREMLTEWHARTELGEVLTAEVKETYPIKTRVGEIPFNYIWDRFDKVGDHEYAVIDYKTNRWGLTPEQLRQKIQARMYGLMAQIKYPDAERIWVKFDMLRHGGYVGVVFSKEENAQTWKWLKKEIDRILDADEDNPPETLNPECVWCIRKATCDALQSNISVGGIMGLPVEEQISLRAKVEYQTKALKNLAESLDALIEAEARNQDVTELESADAKIGFTMSSRRAVDAERVAQVVGDSVFAAYGGATISMGEFDKLLKDPRVTDDQRRILKGLIYNRTGEPRLKVEKKSTFGP